MNASTLFRCPEHKLMAYGLLVAIALLTSFLLLANPSFFSHDEWDKYDHVIQHGLWQYLVDYVSLPQSDDFGRPIRPVSFLVQGLVAPFMISAPIIVHLVDILMHATVAILLFEITSRISRNKNLSWVAAILFLVSPLATFSVGWSAALMDRLFVLFGIVALLAAHAYVIKSSGVIALVVVFVASALAILSKETALILPATLAVLVLYSVVSWRDKRLWIVLLVWSTPIMLFMAYRLPALINSLTGKVVSPYATSLLNVPEAILAYAIYPFAWAVSEVHTLPAQPEFRLWIAGVIHLLLIGVIWRLFSVRAVLIYLAGYFVFLLPILPISIRGAHYLYGSGIAFSIALAAIFTLRWQQMSIALRIVPIVAVAVMLLHSLVVQVFFYITGNCMATAARTIESVYLSNGKPAEIVISIQKGSLGHVIKRFAHGRSVIGTHFPIKTKAIDEDLSEAETASFIFDRSCIVSRR
jgi:hypothetical protein